MPYCARLRTPPPYEGVTVEPRKFAGQRCELVVGGANPDFVQVGHVPHHAIDDGIRLVDALGSKLLHVLIDLRCQPAEFVHAYGMAHSKSVATFASTSSMIEAGKVSTLRAWRAAKSITRG